MYMCIETVFITHKYHVTFKCLLKELSISVTDPGFPVGGCQPRSGVPTPKAATFQKICMSKRNNLDPWGHAPVAPPWIRH